MPDLGSNMDLPFERDPVGFDLPVTDFSLAFGVVVLASTVNLPGVGVKPAVGFRFADGRGGWLPPVLLVQDDEQLAKMRPLINQAIHAAREAAKAERGKA